MPGVGHIVHCMNDGVYFFVLEIEKVLEKGVSLMDLVTFMDTPEGGKLVRDIMPLPRGMIVHIPWGFLFWPIFTGNENNSGTGKELAQIWMQPTWNNTGVGCVKKNVLKALSDYNLELLNRTVILT